MGEIGCFGDIVFEVSDKKVLSFTGFKRDTQSKYENHELIGQKPRTEFVAPGLDTVSFTVILKSQFGVKPRDEMNRWLEYCRGGNAEILVIGGKPLGVDKWVITSVSQAWDTIFGNGELVSGKVDVSLQEYVETMWTVKGYRDRLTNTNSNTGTAANNISNKEIDGSEYGVVKTTVPIYNENGELISSSVYNPVTNEIDNPKELVYTSNSSSSTQIDYLGLNDDNSEILSLIEEIRKYKAKKLNDFYRLLYGGSSATIYGTDIWDKPLNAVDIIDYIQAKGINIERKKDYSWIMNSPTGGKPFGVDTITEYYTYKNFYDNPMSYGDFMNTCGSFWEADAKARWPGEMMNWLNVMVSLATAGLSGYCILSNVQISRINVNIPKANWGAVTDGYGNIYVLIDVGTTVTSIPAIDVSAVPAVLLDQLMFAISNNGVSGMPPDDISKIGDDFGKAGKLVENPGTKVDWSKISLHGIKRMNERGVTQDMVESWVKNGKALVQGGGSKHLFFSREGAVVVATDGTVITAIPKSMYDEAYQFLLKTLFGY